MQVPLFPLNAVVFPAVTLPLHIFEQRYRDMMGHLLSIDDPKQRVFGIVAIREGYEVGSHEAHSMYRVGTLVQLTEQEQYGDGRYAIEVVGRSRLRVDGVDTTGSFVVAEVTELHDQSGPDDREQATEAAARALATFEEYRDLLSDLRGDDVLAGTMPRDPELLSYSLAATALLSLRQRQTLLELDATPERLGALRHMLREEIRAMRAIPSLPATEVARTNWSPN